MIVIIFKQFLKANLDERFLFLFLGRIFVIWLQKKNNPLLLAQTTGASHCSLAIYIKKYLKSKEES
jgi:hypothetical protein